MERSAVAPSAESSVLLPADGSAGCLANSWVAQKDVKSAAYWEHDSVDRTAVLKAADWVANSVALMGL